jgi:predicted phosphoribosyltransferase
LNETVVTLLRLRLGDIELVAARETLEIERREQAYRGDRPASPLGGRDVILIDDGLATGSTMRAGIAAVRSHAPARITVAVPIAAEETCRELRPDVDEIVCLATPDPFYAVGAWYRDFAQVTDEEVQTLLTRHAHHQASAPKQVS